MEVYYKPKDIVWVKLGPFWWPGEVVEKNCVPEDLLETLKKEPIAIVKFFDDDGYYEFVKSPEGIYPYNCERKIDFIKKGMDAFRAKNPKMTSFPKDVSAAEVKTGGNANILSDPVFTTERKRNYAAEIFGSPTAKKPRESHKARATKSEPIITHRRFLGYDDYEARVLIPTAEKDAQQDRVATVVSAMEPTFNKFTCPICQFTTDRLGILTKHTSCHVKDVAFQSRQPIKKPQKRKRKKPSSDDDLPGDDKKTKTKRKYTKKRADESTLADDERSESDMSFAKDPAAKKSPVLEQKKDICDDIIADWDDEDHEDSLEKDTTLDSTLKESEPNESSSLLDSSVLQSPGANLESTRVEEETKEESDQDATDKNKSCFDFDENEEDTRIPDAASGRKIPRVIPVSDRRKTFELEEEEEELRKKKILEEAEEISKLAEGPKDEDKEAETLTKTYQSLMEETENLSIPDVPNVLKNEQNFHSAKTVKYPDKAGEEVEEKVAVLEEGSREDLADKETGKNAKKGRILRSRLEIKESDIDALMAKHEMEARNSDERETEPAKTKVPSDEKPEKSQEEIATLEQADTEKLDEKEIAMEVPPPVEHSADVPEEPKTDNLEVAKEAPEPKRRKTTRSSKGGEEPPRKNQRGDDSSEPENDQKTSRGTRRSTRWDKNSSKADADKPQDSVKQPALDREEINFIVGVVEVKESPKGEDAKTEKDVEPVSDEKEHRGISKNEDAGPSVEETEVSPGKIEDSAKSSRSKRSSEREKRNEDRRKHEPKESSRKSGRHEKDRSGTAEDKTKQPEDHSGSSRRSRGTKERHSPERDDSVRRSSRGDGKKESGEHKSKDSPVREPKVDQKVHGSSRSSRRHSRSRDSPKSKETRSPPKREQKAEAAPARVEPELRSKRSDKSKEDAIDPIKELFAPSGHVAKTREQKREELKSIFSFDYDEKDFRKRKTYGHRRKSKPVDEEKVAATEPNEADVGDQAKVDAEEKTPKEEESISGGAQDVPQNAIEQFEVPNEVAKHLETDVVSEQNNCEKPDQKQSEDQNITELAKDKIDDAEVPPQVSEAPKQQENENDSNLTQNQVETTKTRVKKPRKPSRWDKIEKTNEEPTNAQEENKKAEETPEIEPCKDATKSETSLDVDETSQKEMDDIFSKKQLDNNTEQIELIFGTSPLPGSNENTVSIELHEKSEEEKPTFDKEKNDEDGGSSKNSSFELVSEPMDSLESQVARITHYEEPERIVPKEKDESVFEAPGKSEEPAGAIGETAVIEAESTEKAPPSSQTTKAEKEEVQEARTKPNDVATKLTNPKKRFVKSFEDSEMNKQKEKPAEEEAKPQTSLITGKSPIAFKLKKQFLSKGSIFDEPDEEKRPKALPRLRSLKNDGAFLVKKKTPDASSKTETVSEAKNEPETKIAEASATVEKDEEPIATSNTPETVSENKESCQNITEEKTTDTKTYGAENSSNLVHFSSESNSVDFCIDSTRSILGNLEELKELKPVLDEHSSKVTSEPSSKTEDHIDLSKTEIITKNFPIDEDKKDTEYVSIDGNLTVVSEKELAEGQVEITASMPKKKPMTLLSFSMDFSDESSDATFEVFGKGKAKDITESPVGKEKVVTEKENDPKETTKSLEIEKEKACEVSNQKPTSDAEDQVVNTSERLMNNIEIETMGEESPTDDSNKEPAISTVANQSDNAGSTSSKKEPNEIENTETEKGASACVEAKNDSHPVPPQITARSPARPSETVKSRVRRNEKKVVNEPLVIYNTAKSSTVTEMCDLEDHIPSQIVCTKLNEEVMKAAGINNDPKKDASSEPEISKLLSRLTTDKREDQMSKMKASEMEQKNLLKSTVKGKTVVPAKPTNKAIILSEKIIRPAREIAATAQKRAFEDVEDIEPYVISKNPKLDAVKKEETLVSSSTTAKNSQKQIVMNAGGKQVHIVKKPSGKAKILNQTIIRPAVEGANKAPVGTEDNTEFDINSMPIVLSDELLTPESLESMPIVLGEQTQKAVPASEGMKIVIEKKAPSTPKFVTKSIAVSSSPAGSPGAVRVPVMKRTTPKILQTARPPQKVIRQTTPTASMKSGKLVVVSDAQNRGVPQIVKKPPSVLRKTTLPTTAASGAPSSESTGHKIMIFTNQQGKQQRLLLTPAQQKMFGMQLPGKTVVKSATMAQKSQMAKVQTGAAPSTSKVAVQVPKLVKTGTAQVSTPQMKIVAPRKTQKVQTPGQPQTNRQKTIVITSQHGQTVRRIQGTNEALLDKQVAEQLEAIKVSSMRAQQKQQEARAAVARGQSTPVRKAVIKKPEPKQVVAPPVRSQPSPSMPPSSAKLSEPKLPPLVPVQTEKKPEEAKRQPAAKPSTPKKQQNRPLHQLVIQDAVGNQTTITEGQILALPSETLDGQPQSYMLVTLDESGNLTPLNNEALMSLDPSLAGLAGGDLSNMVIQMDAGTSKDNAEQLPEASPAPEKPQQQQAAPPKTAAPVEQATAQVQVTCNLNGEQGQQIILTGDPVATQKFLDSLSDGSTDLANILAGAEGGSFLIQADGQQILVNTDPSEAPGLLQHGANIADQPDQGNPMFPTKNQDILAAALADTDVFQQDQVTGQGKMAHSQLSPGQTLFPMNVGNVLETSLTLNSPIMTPLEVPSTNSKRIPDEEADILTTHVPKNVDLPITITDPNISQTVSHQQVLMASDLQSNLELSLPISETSMSVSTDMNSPSFVYSLPNLDVSEHAEINQKAFSGSMPLLTEDMEEKNPFSALSKPSTLEVAVSAAITSKNGKQTLRKEASGDTFIEEGLCTLGAEMCSSLSEPPPEMFDIPMENDGLNFLSNKPSKDKSEATSEESSLHNTDDNSLKISVQSEVVSDFKDASSQSSDSSSSVSQDKKL